MVEVIEIFETGEFETYESDILTALNKYDKLDYSITWNLVTDTEESEITIVHKQKTMYITVPVIDDFIGEPF